MNLQQMQLVDKTYKVKILPNFCIMCLSVSGIKICFQSNKSSFMIQNFDAAKQEGTILGKIITVWGTDLSL